MKIRDKGYRVFNIDYRLSCQEDIWICGFSFSVPPSDAKTAIGWARANLPNNGRVVAIGTSGGGNLFFDANNQGVTGSTRPDVVAGVSGPTELGYMTNGHISCADSWIPHGAQNKCWPHTELFMGGAIQGGPTVCTDTWAPGSPACNIPTSGAKPTFIANASEENTPFQEADDYNTNLGNQLVVTYLCKVSNAAWKHNHGTQLLLAAVKCDNRTDYVFDWMMSWISTH